MCGIFAYIGKDDAIKSCINGIKQLEYRGYDSAGIAGIIDGKIHFCKQIGNISSLEKKIKLQDLKLDFAIAHTRWATHGKPNEINAHPHFDDNESLALVHNGIIENHHEIKQELIAKGKTFTTDTDTEVIAQLISFNYL